MRSQRDVQILLGMDEPAHLLLRSEEFETWAIGEDLVAKFPRTAVNAEKVPTEAAVHPLLRRLLGHVVPAIRMVGELDDGSGFPVIVHERAGGVQGQTNEGDTIVQGPGLAEHVGSILATLHEVPAREAFALGLGERSVAFDTPVIEDATLERVTAIVGDAVSRFLASSPAAPSQRRTLCHTDIKGEHIFVDTDHASVTSIIDWADTEVCDPARDYAGLVIWLGPDFARAAAAAGEPDDATLADRAIWLARAGALEWLDDVQAGREEAPPSTLIDRQLRAAFPASD
jgi:aminoglycoside phosphotransferase (APT) family kinase protein